MPRIKSEPKKCIKTNIQEREFLQFSDQYTGSGTPDIVTLRHPKTAKSAIFLFSSANSSVQEILTVCDGKRSWFVKETVKSDGKMFLSTPIDPMFLVIPYLRRHGTAQAVPLDHMLYDKDFPETERLLKSTGLTSLTAISDRKGDDEVSAFKYNEEKTLLWLKKKTQRVADIVKQKNIQISGSATPATFVQTAGDDATESDVYLRYAHGIVSEYLMQDLSQKLLNYLNLPEAKYAGDKRKSSVDDNPETKRARLDKEDEKLATAAAAVLDLSQPDLKSSKSSNLSGKEKSRMKAAAGMKSISSFFKKA